MLVYEDFMLLGSVGMDKKSRVRLSRMGCRNFDGKEGGSAAMLEDEPERCLA